MSPCSVRRHRQTFSRRSRKTIAENQRVFGRYAGFGDVNIRAAQSGEGDAVNTSAAWVGAGTTRLSTPTAEPCFTKAFIRVPSGFNLDIVLLK